MKHSTVVGGSTAKRVMACPGSVALCAKMPPKPSSMYADRGTLLHDCMADILGNDVDPVKLIGRAYEKQILTAELIEEKITPALAALDAIDPEQDMQYMVEAEVDFGDFLPGAFGSCDLLGRISQRALAVDWKFGDGVAVDVEENEQLMFYVAAAMRTEKTKWVFDDVTEIECIIVQPPEVKRWVTTPERIRSFELELKRRVKLSQTDEAPLAAGDHCKWCSAKPVCPLITGAVDRALKSNLDSLDAPTIGAYLKNAELLESWITDLRALAFTMLEGDIKVPGWKLVAKRGSRKWLDEQLAKTALLTNLPESEVTESSLISVAQAEKKLKKLKLDLPNDLFVSISSGSTLATADDPRPEVMQLGRQLNAAISKLI